MLVDVEVPAPKTRPPPAATQAKTAPVIRARNSDDYADMDDEDLDLVDTKPILGKNFSFSSSFFFLSAEIV